MTTDGDYAYILKKNGALHPWSDSDSDGPDRSRSPGAASSVHVPTFLADGYYA